MATDFIRAKVLADNASGKYGGRVVTRFPPEPNGYPHIGHAKSVHLNFGLAAEFGGRCHLRYDDTNPETEDEEYARAILRDVRWLGYDPAPHIYYASDYYEQLYTYAVKLIERGLAYVCPLSDEEIRVWRGTVSEPGRPSPGRDRTVAENLDLFARMRKGEFADGTYTLRARIDMSAANMKLRDPLLYRIRHATHYRTGDAWCIYPMYDYAHPLSDAIEGITHSICTLEFENNRDIYDWLMRACEIPNPPEQTEFARLNLNYSVMSKRKFLHLVNNRLVDGWDDPRMPTLSGMRRRGYTPSGIRTFCEKIGIAKANSTVDFALLEECIRDDLNPVAPRVLCVLRPLKVVVTTWPEGEVEWLDAPSYPAELGREGSRPLPFTRELFVERDDFAEVPAKGWHRLAPGATVRLRHGYVVRVDEVVKDGDRVVELRCSHDPATRSGTGSAKVKGTIHWVSADRSVACEVRLYDRLFSVERPGADRDVEADLNPASLEVLAGARIEPSVAEAARDTRFQFERLGYFWRDPESVGLVFNRTVPLKDSWARAEAPRPEAPRPEASAPTRAERPEAAAEARKPRALEGEAALRRDRLVAAGVEPADAERIGEDAGLTAWTEAGLVGGTPAAALAKWVVNEVLRDVKERALADLPLTPVALGALVRRVADGSVSTATARKVYAELLASGGDPEAILAAQAPALSGDALGAAVATVLAANPGPVESYRGGKVQLLGFFVGQVMKATGGRANPADVQAAVKAALAP